MLFGEKMSKFRQSFAYLQYTIIILSSFSWTFFGAHPAQGQDEDLVNLEIVLIDLPTFRTGETGPEAV